MAENAPNPWKLATLGVLLVLATAVVTTLVVTKRSPSAPARSTPAQGARRGGAGGGASQPVGNQPTAQPGTPATQQPAAGGALPTQAVVNDCNRYASSPRSDRDKLWEIGKDVVIGGAATAALGAAAGAIADGGKGAGKGAAIGDIFGAGGGALYGINENHKQDEEYRTAYANCMRARGYAY